MADELQIQQQQKSKVLPYATVAGVAGIPAGMWLVPKIAAKKVTAQEIRSCKTIEDLYQLAENK